MFLKEGVKKWDTAPVGSGPFYVAKYLPGQYTLLKKNPYYWETDPAATTTRTSAR